MPSSLVPAALSEQFAALAERFAAFQQANENNPYAHAAWLGPLVLLGAYLLGKFFDWVGKLEKNQLDEHRKTALAAEALADGKAAAAASKPKGGAEKKRD